MELVPLCWIWRRQVEEDEEEIMDIKRKTWVRKTFVEKAREKLELLTNSPRLISQKQKAALREAYKDKKFLPLDLRAKKTRAIRRRLTKHQQSLKTEREKKREMYFPVRKYAIKV